MEARLCRKAYSLSGSVIPLTGTTQYRVFGKLLVLAMEV